MKKICVIPAYEPPEEFVDYARGLVSVLDHLVVVDDGSGEKYAPVFDALGAMEKVHVIAYPKNRGKGYALKQAFRYCKENFQPGDILVTADCDGQHAVDDVVRVCSAAQSSADALVLGVRDFSAANVPRRSAVGNRNMLFLLRLLYGIRLTDSQTGLRAFSVARAGDFLQVEGSRFEYETGMLIYAKRRQIPVREVQIQTVYPEDPADHVSHFKTVRDSLRVVGTVIYHLVDYFAACGVSVVADIGIFVGLTYWIFPDGPGFTMLATVAARIISSLIQFFLSCRRVFYGQPGESIFRFYILCAGQMCCSYGIVYLFGHLLGGELAVVKVLGDLCLALISYQIQCRWVYRKREGFYGSYARFARHLLRCFSPRYRCRGEVVEGPAVYVCRHLNMHGPYTTLKWLPVQVHPMIMHMFFDADKAARHLHSYTFAERNGKAPARTQLVSRLVGAVTAPLVKSLQGIPVYRGGSDSVTTLKTALKYLRAGEPVIVYPDVDYTGSYEKPSELYPGFGALGQMYQRRTGQPLPFVPLYIDDENRQICIRPPVYIQSFREDGERGLEAIKTAINPTDTSPALEIQPQMQYNVLT